MKHLVLSICTALIVTAASAQCSVDTIPSNANSNNGECYISDVYVDASPISTSSGFQTAGVSYQSFNSPYINLRQGEMPYFEISIVHSTNYSICAWIDYNADGIYSPTEIVFYTQFANIGLYGMNVNVPMNVAADTLSMRISVQQYATTWGTGLNDACDAPGIGEVEDYKVIILCAYPQGLAYDPTPTICLQDSVELNAFSGADVAWYTGSPATLQHIGSNFYLHTSPSSTDTTVYLQFATPGCFSAPMDSMYITFLPSPIANILSPDTIQSCSSVVISATPGPYNYFWNNGDTGSTITINQGFGGTLSLSVSAPNGCYDYDQIYVQIAPDPPATYTNVTPGFTYCQNLELFLTYDSLIAPGTCSWYTYPGNTFIGTGTQVIYTLPDTGTYQFMAIVNSVCGIDTIIRTFEGRYGVAYDSMYVVNADFISNMYMFCYGNSGYITGILAGLEGTVDHWELTDVTMGFTMPWNDDDTLQLPANMAQQGHIYSVYAVVQNIYGCFDTTETVLLSPHNTMNFNLPDTSFRCSFPVSIGFGPVNYAVYDLLYSTGDTTNTILLNGPAALTLYAIDNNTGCETYDTTYVADASAVTTLLTDTTYSCSGPPYFDSNNTPYSIDYWEEFDLSWNMINGGTNPDYFVVSSGDCYVVFHGYNVHGCYINDTTYISLNGNFTFSLGPDITTMTTPVTLSGPSGNGLYTYTWAPVSSNGQSIQVSTSGTYSLTVDNGYGCSYTDAIVVTILPTAVQETSTFNLTVYPNPAHDLITIQSTETITTVNILDLNGRVVSSQSCSAMNVEIRIAELPDGCYILESVGEHGVTRTRLLKQ
jgi:hypothetical protein